MKRYNIICFCKASSVSREIYVDVPSELSNMLPQLRLIPAKRSKTNIDKYINGR